MSWNWMDLFARSGDHSDVAIHDDNLYRTTHDTIPDPFTWTDDGRGHGNPWSSAVPRQHVRVGRRIDVGLDGLQRRRCWPRKFLFPALLIDHVVLICASKPAHYNT